MKYFIFHPFLFIFCPPLMIIATFHTCVQIWFFSPFCFRFIYIFYYYYFLLFSIVLIYSFSLSLSFFSIFLFIFFKFDLRCFDYCSSFFSPLFFVLDFFFTFKFRFQIIFCTENLFFFFTRIKFPYDLYLFVDLERYGGEQKFKNRVVSGH